jgi:hypothetical protein
MWMCLPFRRNMMVAGTLLTLVGCAVTTPPPRFTAVSPADPAAGESTVPAPAALLTGDGELAEKTATAGSADEAPPAGPTSGPTGHEQHGMAADTTVFTCPMHPEVATKEPGKCPICGTVLVKNAARPKERP